MTITKWKKLYNDCDNATNSVVVHDNKTKTMSLSSYCVPSSHIATEHIVKMITRGCGLATQPGMRALALRMRHSVEKGAMIIA